MDRDRERDRAVREDASAFKVFVGGIPWTLDDKGLKQSALRLAERGGEELHGKYRSEGEGKKDPLNSIDHSISITLLGVGKQEE